jgi:2-isopropylmalate synthase
MKNGNRLIIFDTTLRDGEQSPGASLNVQEKLEVAVQLARLGVDVIEGGFPITSPGDFEAVELMAKKIKGPEICGLARCVKGDIDAAWNAVKSAKKPRIHVFIATSRIHMEKKLRMTPQQVLDRINDMVTYASKFCENIEFSTEDAVRSDFEFLTKAVKTAIDAGASTINIPDTVGYAIPLEFGEMIRRLLLEVPGSDKVIFSVHCHNDLGLAVSNSLAALQNGARQVECTVNGIGERAGNASLEEIVMATKTRPDLFSLTTGINTEEIYRSSRLVSRLTGIPVQPNKAIVGANAFSHESGIHQDGVMKHSRTYEIMTPESVGVPSSQLILGKHSGRHALQKRMKELGVELDGSDLDDLFAKFKGLADKKKYVFDEDILALVEEGADAAWSICRQVPGRASCQPPRSVSLMITLFIKKPPVVTARWTRFIKPLIKSQKSLSACWIINWPRSRVEKTPKAKSPFNWSMPQAPPSVEKACPRISLKPAPKRI